jgi:hypothetical protein
MLLLPQTAAPLLPLLWLLLLQALLPAGLQHLLLLRKECQLPLLLQLVVASAQLPAHQSACPTSPVLLHAPNPGPQLLLGRC